MYYYRTKKLPPLTDRRATATAGREGYHYCWVGGVPLLQDERVVLLQVGRSTTSDCKKKYYYQTGGLPLLRSHTSFKAEKKEPGFCRALEVPPAI